MRVASSSCTKHCMFPASDGVAMAVVLGILYHRTLVSSYCRRLVADSSAETAVHVGTTIQASCEVFEGNSNSNTSRPNGEDKEESRELQHRPKFLSERNIIVVPLVVRIDGSPVWVDCIQSDLPSEVVCLRFRYNLWQDSALGLCERTRHGCETVDVGMSNNEAIGIALRFSTGQQVTSENCG